MLDDYSRIVSEAKYRPKDEEDLKILTPKQMLQKLPIAFAQIKSGDTFKNLLNEIRQVIYSLHQTQEITKKIYNNITNSIKL